MSICMQKFNRANNDTIALTEKTATAVNCEYF